jgi:hypothetical protein
MANKIQLRRDTASNWTTTNPILSQGEPGLELGTNKIKYGDGTTPWVDLSYATTTTDNIKFITDFIYDPAGITIENADLTHGATAAVVVPGNGTTNALQVNNFYGPVNITSGDNNITQSWQFNSDGSMTLPNYVKQNTNPSVTCNAGMDTVIYTGTDRYIHTFKLLLKVEGVEVNGQSWETQSTEMIIAKSFNNDKVAATAYGVVHTSIDPLATFTARWNPTLFRVEVLCHPTSLTYGVEVRTFATEIITSD